MTGQRDETGNIRISTDAEALQKCEAERDTYKAEIEQLRAALEGDEPFAYDPATGFIHEIDGGEPDYAVRWKREGDPQ